MEHEKELARQSRGGARENIIGNTYTYANLVEGPWHLQRTEMQHKWMGRGMSLSGTLEATSLSLVSITGVTGIL